MRTTKEVLDFIEEQIWFIETQIKDKGIKKPFISKISNEITQNSLEQKYWLYQNLKWFINEEI